MAVPPALTRLKPRRPHVVLAFVVLLVATTVTYGMTAAGHYSTFKTYEVEGSVVGYHVEETDYGPVVVADVEIRNPLLRSVTVQGVVLAAKVNGTPVARLGGVYQGVTVPAGETQVVSMELRPMQNRTDEAVAGAEAGTIRISGSARARLGDYRFQFDVNMAGGDDR